MVIIIRKLDFWGSFKATYCKPESPTVKVALLLNDKYPLVVLSCHVFVFFRHSKKRQKKMQISFLLWASGVKLGRLICCHFAASSGNWLIATHPTSPHFTSLCAKHTIFWRILEIYTLPIWYTQYIVLILKGIGLSRPHLTHFTVPNTQFSKLAKGT